MAVLKQVKLYYPNLLKKNELSDKYQVNIGGLTDEHIRILTKELGIDEDAIKEPRVFTKKEDPEGTKQKIANEQGRFIVARSEFPVTVKNGKKEKLSDDVVKTIGNGSLANVQVNAYDWTFKKESGVSAGLQQIMLKKLEKFEGFKDEFEEEDDELSDSDSSDGLPEDEFEEEDLD